MYFFFTSMGITFSLQKGIHDNISTEAVHSISFKQYKSVSQILYVLSLQKGRKGRMAYNILITELKHCTSFFYQCLVAYFLLLLAHPLSIYSLLNFSYVQFICFLLEAEGPGKWLVDDGYNSDNLG